MSRFKGITTRWPFLLFAAGAVSIVAGTALVSVPAALIVAGIALVAAAVQEVLF